MKGIKMIKLLLLGLFVFLQGCGGVIEYKPKVVPIVDAIDVMDELIMTQPRRRRPDGFGIGKSMFL